MTLDHENIFMTPEELSEIGKKLLGNRWKTPLAKEIGIARETLSRWASGKQPIPAIAINSITLLSQKIQLSAYKEKRHRAYGESKKIGEAQLIHGDSRKIDLIKSVDVIITDPVWPNAISSLSGAHNPYQLFLESIHNLSRFLKPEGRIIIQLRCDSDPRILKAIPETFPFIRTVWLPYAVPSRQGRMLISGDIAYIFGKPPKSRKGYHILAGQMHTDFCPPKQPENKNISHPCPRNLAHVEWLVEKFTLPDEIILDPFMGSGTTAVAALKRGRQFIGVEIEKKYWLSSEKRIHEELLQLE